MADVKITCVANDVLEEISQYHFFQDDVEVGVAALPEFTVTGVAAGTHKYEVAAENVWGIGPKSDPVFTPPAPSKCGGVNISVVVNINVS